MRALSSQHVLCNRLAGLLPVCVGMGGGVEWRAGAQVSPLFPFPPPTPSPRPLPLGAQRGERKGAQRDGMRAAALPITILSPVLLPAVSVSLSDTFPLLPAGVRRTALACRWKWEWVGGEGGREGRGEQRCGAENGRPESAVQTDSGK